MHQQLLDELFKGADYKAGSAAQAAASALLAALCEMQQCLSNIKAELRASSGDHGLALAALLVADVANLVADSSRQNTSHPIHCRGDHTGWR